MQTKEQINKIFDNSIHVVENINTVIKIHKNLFKRANY